MRGQDDRARIRIVSTGYRLFDSFMGLVFCGGEVMEWQDKWQTIKSAPKRGVYVLLFDPKSDDPVFVGYHRYRQWNPCFMENWGDHATYPEPTHWMPLPSHGPYK